jgi:hypothetical protein
LIGLRQKVPADFVDPDTVGLYASIGIRKGQPFAPEERMKKILTEAVAVGNATARTMLFDSRDPATKFEPDRQWLTAVVGGSYQVLDGAARLLDARTMYFYIAGGITPAMSMAKVGSGSAYADAFRHSKGDYLDDGKTYKITLPNPVPAKAFWSFVVNDNQTRSLLETDQKLDGVDSTDPKLKVGADGSATIWFGPKAPAGGESNWVREVKVAPAVLDHALPRESSGRARRACPNALDPGAKRSRGPGYGEPSNRRAGAVARARRGRTKDPQPGASSASHAPR